MTTAVGVFLTLYGVFMMVGAILSRCGRDCEWVIEVSRKGGPSSHQDSNRWMYLYYPVADPSDRRWSDYNYGSAWSARFEAKRLIRQITETVNITPETKSKTVKARCK